MDIQEVGNVTRQIIGVEHRAGYLQTFSSFILVPVDATYHKMLAFFSHLDPMTFYIMSLSLEGFPSCAVSPAAIKERGA